MFSDHPANGFADSAKRGRRRLRTRTCGLFQLLDVGKQEALFFRQVGGEFFGKTLKQVPREGEFGVSPSAEHALIPQSAKTVAGLHSGHRNGAPS
jgi:hypothetical protein